jgi:L-alanine-DL-glutamate epimerase-like enolase superfamily enzyme
VEWDEVSTPGIAAEGYTIDEGWVTIPNAPGFGLTLDEDRFAEAIASGGFDLRL